MTPKASESSLIEDLRHNTEDLDLRVRELRMNLSDIRGTLKWVTALIYFVLGNSVVILGIAFNTIWWSANMDKDVADLKLDAYTRHDAALHTLQNKSDITALETKLDFTSRELERKVSGVAADSAATLISVNAIKMRLGMPSAYEKKMDMLSGKTKSP